MKIAICSSEVFPFAKTGGLGDVCGSLPLALEKIGIDVSVFLPKYQGIDDKQFHLEAVCENCVKTTLGQNITVYLMENDDFFLRDGLYGDAFGDYPDNLERFQYYCLKSLDVMKHLNEPYDVIHCHDWQSSLIPVYMKEKYGHDPFFTKTKTLLTIHNMAFQGIFPKQEFSSLELKQSLLESHTIESFEKINLLKAGILLSHKVSTVSQQYAKEIQTKAFGCGLDEVLRSRKDGIGGVLNGFDHEVWNPQTDELITKKYSAADFIEGKRENKLELQKYFNLEVSPDIPVLGFVGRLSDQKGIDLILDAASTLGEKGIQLIILGVGEEKFHQLLSRLPNLCPGKIAVCLKFDEKIAHQIYSGSDLLLMPSKFEPCGLSQIISLRYGTVPVVFKTGGLVDTISHYDPSSESSNGFVFDQYTSEAFLGTLEKALEVYQNKDQFQRLIRNAFAADFSWENSAHEYQKIYQCLSSD